MSDYSTTSFIEDMLERGHSGTLPELIVISKEERARAEYEKETEGERSDEGEMTPEEKQERADRLNQI